MGLPETRTDVGGRPSHSGSVTNGTHGSQESEDDALGMEILVTGTRTVVNRRSQ